MKLVLLVAACFVILLFSLSVEGFLAAVQHDIQPLSLWC